MNIQIVPLAQVPARAERFTGLTETLMALKPRQAGFIPATEEASIAQLRARINSVGHYVRTRKAAQPGKRLRVQVSRGEREGVYFWWVPSS